MSDVIKTLGDLVAKQKLVPFMGAGCSASMLPDWDSLVGEMAEQIGIASTNDHLKIAQKYVDTLGREKFCNYLKNKLEITDFDDEKGFIHLTITRLGVPAIYTTNQDNVMEKCYEKYGGTYRKIVQLEDFAEARLSEQLYIKFHGDLNYPDSIVFTEEDYDRRMSEQQNALNIRLRADLLAKNILFIGYSFRDINIQQMFSELHNAFFGKLPTSYMIAYRYSSQLQELCDKFGIILIDPMKEFPNSRDNKEAFQLCLKSILDESVLKKFDDEITELFSPKIFRPTRVISMMDVNTLEESIFKLPPSKGIELFRMTCDAADMPVDFEDRITTIFIELAKRIENHEDTESLKPAVFHLKLTNPLNKMKAVAAIMATANVRISRDKYGADLFHFPVKEVNNSLYIVIAAKAIEYIYSWGKRPTEVFVYNIKRWIQEGADIETLPVHLKEYVIGWVEKMRRDCYTVFDNPLQKTNRLRYREAAPLTSDEIEQLSRFIDYK
ncbi:SIR2 family protein [Bacillus thuringiensis]|nr:SIR2 family protein [Bacillus thuringiensis]